VIWFWLEPKDELIDYEFKDDTEEIIEMKPLK